MAPQKAAASHPATGKRRHAITAITRIAGARWSRNTKVRPSKAPPESASARDLPVAPHRRSALQNNVNAATHNVSGMEDKNLSRRSAERDRGKEGVRTGIERREA